MNKVAIWSLDSMSSVRILCEIVLQNSKQGNPFNSSTQTLCGNKFQHI